MCGMKRTPYGIPDGGNDMARMRGWGLRLLRQADVEAELDALIDELAEIDIDDPDNREHVMMLADAIAGLESGDYRARVQPYDPADERAVKVGHENPIEWVRRQDAERQRQGRKLAWKRQA
jgi:hypothetical protein